MCFFILLAFSFSSKFFTRGHTTDRIIPVIKAIGDAEKQLGLELYISVELDLCRFLVWFFAIWCMYILSHFLVHHSLCRLLGTSWYTDIYR